MYARERAIVEALVGVAWADGRFATAEQEMIDAALSAFRATDAEIDQIRAWAASPRSFEDIDVDHLLPEDRRRLLDLAVVLSMIDGEQLEDEAALVDRLVVRLGLDLREASAVVAAAEQRAHRLVELL